MSIDPLLLVQEVTGVVLPGTLIGGLVFGMVAIAVAVQPEPVAVTVTE